MKEIFDPILLTFENEDIMQFMVEKCMPTIPKYFWEVPASSSFKYHPVYAVTVPLGLAKHTVALVRILNHMFSVESVANQFTSRERDLLRIAGLMHDTRKSGDQADYQKNKWTKFDHPLKAAEVIRGLDGLPAEEIELIAHVIESHMGQWNKNKKDPDVVLPKPEDKYQIIVHLADYLASRKDINIDFEDLPDTTEFKEKKVEDVDPYDFEVHFKKHYGLTWPEIEEIDPGYIDWAKDKEGYAFDVLRKYLKEKNA